MVFKGISMLRVNYIHPYSTNFPFSSKKKKDHHYAKSHFYLSKHSLENKNDPNKVYQFNGSKSLQKWRSGRTATFGDFIYHRMLNFFFSPKICHFFALFFINLLQIRISSDFGFEITKLNFSYELVCL